MDGAIQNMGDLAVTRAMAPSLKGGLSVAAAQKIDKTAQDFEGMFMTQMLQPMFETVSVDPIFGGGHGEEVMRNFLVQEYGRTIAKTHSLGIADEVKQEMIRLQEKAHPATDANAVQGAAP